MATSRTPAPPPVSMAVGIGPNGELPLPWLAAPLADALALARTSHALLVHGPAGTGHLEFALLLAQTLLCESVAGVPARACGHCASCHGVRTRVHPDLLVVLPDALRVQLGWVGDDERVTKGDTKPSRDLRVEQVRQAIAWTQSSSGRGRGKLLLLHPADALNGPAANALLKTLEEPPGRQHIVLTSADPERLLPTVRSRCQRLALPLPPSDDAARWLQAQGLADPLPLLAAAGGSPLEALAWARDGLDTALLAALPRRLASGDASALAGHGLPRAIDLMLKLAHDALAQAAGGAPRFFPGADWPGGADLPALVDWQRALLRAARHDEHPWNAPLLLESLATRAAAAWPAHGAPGPGRAGTPRLHSAR